MGFSRSLLLNTSYFICFDDPSLKISPSCVKKEMFTYLHNNSFMLSEVCFYFEYSSSKQSLYSNEHSSYISTNIANRVAVLLKKEDSHIRKDKAIYLQSGLPSKDSYIRRKHDMLRL